jgi:hypothetical protein
MASIYQARQAVIGPVVRLGTRDPAHLDELKGRGDSARSLRDWLREAGTGASVGTFREAAGFGEMIVNALNGIVRQEVLQAARQTITGMVGPLYENKHIFRIK